MFIFIITIHIIVCVLLVLAVLMQSGRGGGLTESFSSAESIFGTKTSALLTKTTGVLATIFFITCLSLAYFSKLQSKSLIEKIPLTTKETNEDKGSKLDRVEKKTNNNEQKNIE